MRSDLALPSCETVARHVVALMSDRLATAYSDTPLREKVVSLVSKLEFCWIVIGQLDKSLRDKLIKNRPLVCLQICARARQ